MAVAGGTKWMQVGRCAAIAAPESEAGAAELSEAGQMLSQQEEKEEQEAFIEKKKKALEESGDDGSSTKASSLGTSANRTPLGDDGEAENSEHSAGCKCPLCKIKIEPKTGTLQTEEEREVQEKKDAWAAKKAAGGDDDDDEPKKKKKKADRDDNGYGKWETVTVATTYTTGVGSPDHHSPSPPSRGAPCASAIPRSHSAPAVAVRCAACVSPAHALLLAADGPTLPFFPGAQNARMTGHGYKIK